MVFRFSTTKIVSRPIDLSEEILTDLTFVAPDTYIETSRKDEFILGNLFDYNGNKISYIWDSKKNQIASLKGKNLNTELIVLTTQFLKDIYIYNEPKIDINLLSNQIVDSIRGLLIENNPPQEPLQSFITSSTALDIEKEDKDFVLDYKNDNTTPVFTSEFLEDDEEVDDFDEQLALKSQEFLKEHPELKTEMEIVRLLEGN